jgi:hypothetical protein
MQGYFWNTVLVSFLPLLAACFLGILVSNLTESSGYAVAISLVLYLVLNVVTEFLREKYQMYFFTFYLVDGFEQLKRYSQGEGTMGYEPGSQALWFSAKNHLHFP